VAFFFKALGIAAEILFVFTKRLQRKARPASTGSAQARGMP